VALPVWSIDRWSGAAPSWGLLKIKIEPWHLVIDSIGIHEYNGKRWIQLPARAQLTPDRELIREDNGRPRYAKVLEFSDRDVAARFSAAVLAACHEEMQHDG
jgi:hypothetical protein